MKDHFDHQFVMYSSSNRILRALPNPQTRRPGREGAGRGNLKYVHLQLYPDWTLEVQKHSKTKYHLVSSSETIC